MAKEKNPKSSETTEKSVADIMQAVQKYVSSIEVNYALVTEEKTSVNPFQGRMKTKFRG
jgi:hypothetical protein